MSSLSCWRRASWAALFAVFLLVGCSGARKATARGTVTLDGTALDDGAITFIEPQTGAAIGGGAIRNGKFTVKLGPGRYTVRIVASRPIPGSSVPDMGNVPQLASIIPERYNSKTTLTAEVPTGGGEFTFPLTSQ